MVPLLGKTFEVEDSPGMVCPELPPRNTPTPSIIETDSGGGTTSPDYMDVEASLRRYFFGNENYFPTWFLISTFYTIG